MKILSLDIETAPNLCYTWGLFNVNLSLDHIVEPGYTLCWAANWLGEDAVEYSSIHHHGYMPMVTRIHELLEEADIVIHYNGRSFDMPTLNKEFIKAGLKPPTPYHQIDLLQTARKRFRFTSNKLDFVSQFLGLEAKLQHKGMKLWAGCMEGDNESWEIMKEYNIQDVYLLPKLYERLLPWIADHPNMGLYTDTNEIVCTNCGSKHVVKNGVERLATQTYQRYRCQDCGTPMKGRFSITPKEKRHSVLTQSKI